MISYLLPFLAGFALSASLIVAIGAQNLFVLRQGLKKEHVGMIVLFCGLSDALLIVAGVRGMGAFLNRVPQFSTALALAGALFLAWYGLKSLQRAKNQDSMTVIQGQSVSLGKALAAVAAFTWLNPHVYLDTVLLMGTASTAQPIALRPFFAAGAASASFLWFASLGYGARLLQPVFAKPQAWRVLDMLIGCIMLFLAALLFWQGGLHML
ncbi:LysE family transporter [Acetobacter indonesiensis]|uniref:LysE/ArgO family amino acid transporter n=1 Tax=Acetobacter indonesiensis TaxID=104101 RepID=UPI001EFF81CD|nr:LysE family transporter [Acetobacter indonesiensis]MCG0996010.1 LysE family transporter [Acetobacter indonesiensis]